MASAGVLQATAGLCFRRVSSRGETTPSRTRSKTRLAPSSKRRTLAAMASLSPLSPSTLAPTVNLVARCFPTDWGYAWALPVASDPSGFSDVRRQAGLELARQWTCASGHGAISGTFGLYATTEDLAPPNGFVALNWFCVDPEFHGQGLGRALWENILREARAVRVARRLIFYSSTEPHHLRAEKLYLAAGCARRIGPMLPDGVHRLTFFDLALDGSGAADAETARRIYASLERLFAIDCDRSLIEAVEKAAPVPNSGREIAA